MNDVHEEMMKRLVFDDKDFEKEAVTLFTEMFNLEESIREKYDNNHPGELCGLDGGCASELRKVNKEYFIRFEELKKKYNITDI